MTVGVAPLEVRRESCVTHLIRVARNQNHKINGTTEELTRHAMYWYTTVSYVMLVMR